MEIIEFLSEFFKNGLLIYTAALIFAYIGLAIFSIYETRAYLQRNSFVDYSIISESPLAPTISVIAPAYNEGATIIQNVHSLLSLHSKAAKPKVKEVKKAATKKAAPKKAVVKKAAKKATSKSQ